jgi:hypothetical protein
MLKAGLPGDHERSEVLNEKSPDHYEGPYFYDI